MMAVAGMAAMARHGKAWLAEFSRRQARAALPPFWVLRRFACLCAAVKTTAWKPAGTGDRHSVVVPVSFRLRPQVCRQHRDPLPLTVSWRPLSWPLMEFARTGSGSLSISFVFLCDGRCTEPVDQKSLDRFAASSGPWLTSLRPHHPAFGDCWPPEPVPGHSHRKTREESSS